MSFVGRAGLSGVPSGSDVVRTFFDFTRARRRHRTRSVVGTRGLGRRTTEHCVATSLGHRCTDRGNARLGRILPGLDPLGPRCLAGGRDIFRGVSTFIRGFGNIKKRI